MIVMRKVVTYCACHLMLVLAAFFSTNSFATSKSSHDKKHLIVATVPAISGLIDCITNSNDFVVSSIAPGKVCIHSYALKPSQFMLLDRADLIFYINEDFETIISSLKQKNSEKLFELGCNRDLNLIQNENKSTNWHIWISPANIKVIAKDVLYALLQKYPQYSKSFKENYKKNLMPILDTYSSEISKLSLENSIFLSASLRYIFEGKILNGTFVDIESSITSGKVRDLKDALLAYNNTKRIYSSTHVDEDKIKNLLGNINVKTIEIEGRGYYGRYGKALQVMLQDIVKKLSS